jgi:hypothetical protein
MDLLTGNAYEQDTRGTGWFIGFGDWTRLPGSDLLHVPADQPLSGLCVKWYDHPDGHDSGDGKPLSEGRTMSMLATPGSVFRYLFSTEPGFPPEASRAIVLSRPGDYLAWGPGWYHRWHCERRATILTVRWTPA